MKLGFIMGEKVLITSALPYINSIKHLGNLIGSILPADVFARYQRLQGNDVIYICGTDDHGTPAEISAMEANIPVDEFCDEMYITQKKIYEDWNIEFDYFGRTHDIENHEITQEIFLKLMDNGYVVEKTSIQLYSIDDKRYLPDRFVIGICPHCEYENARGDQCENCTTLLDPTDLISPKSSISGSFNLEKRDVKHYYIDLPKLESKIKDWIESQKNWPQTSISIAKKWLKEGLKTRAITRNLDWGIDLPGDYYDPEKVFYVWFDAPIGYISITKKWADKIKKDPKLFSQFWKDEKTKYYQFLGIDNVPFHAITFPGTILGYNEKNKDPYNLTNFIKGFQWLNWEGEKFSSSQKRGIFTDKALEHFPAGYWRYYLLLIAPERQDTSFQWKGFQDAVNNDLNNLLGNLVNRLTTFTSRYFENSIPEAKKGDREIELMGSFQSAFENYISEFKQVEFQKPLKIIRSLWQELNKYFQEKEPWNTVKDKETMDQTKTTVSMLAHGLRITAIMLFPFTPKIASNVLLILGMEDIDIYQEKYDKLLDWEALENTKIPKLEKNLFEKITDENIDKLKKLYGPVESDKVMKNEDNISYEDFSKVKLITVKILNAIEHPNADKLLVLTVNDGERQDRTIVAGIKNDYKIDDLIGKDIIIVDNLKPTKIRGILSEGMLLAAEDEDVVSYLEPNKKVKEGSKIR